MSQSIQPAESSFTSAKILGGAGLAFLIATALASSTVRTALGGTQATGTVVALQRTNRSGKPVVEFSLPDGRRQRFVARTSSSPPAYRVGERVPVVYAPANPAEAVLDTFTEVWLLPVVLAVLGGGCCITGAVHLTQGLERRRIRARLLSAGWRLQGRVASVDEVREKKRRGFLLFIEASHPETGATEQFLLGPVSSKIQLGRAAVVHLEKTAPHRYFAELV